MEHFVFEFVFRSSLIVLTVALVLRALRIRVAAAQHAVWVGVLVAMLVLPIWMSWGPKAALPVLPARVEPAIVVNAAPVSPGVAASPIPESLPIPALSVRAPANTSEAPELRPSIWTWSAILIGTYLLGACALLLRLAIGTIRANRLTSGSCVVPVTVGLLRPRIILPECCSEWPPVQLDAVLTHERAHACRRDPLFQWMALFNRAVFWFHPLAWWLERHLSALAEEACDAAVLESGHDPRDYSEYLLELARAVQRAGTRVNALGMAMPGSYLPQRVRKIIDGVRSQRISRLRMACAALTCAIPAVVFASGTLDRAPQILQMSRLSAGTLPQSPVLLAQAAGLPQQALGQSAGNSPTFDVADVHVSPRSLDPNPYNYVSGGILRGGRYDLRKATMLELIKTAYGVDGDAVLGGPNWLELDRFYVAAKAPPSTPPETLKMMLQSLLADRFKLVIHKDTKPMPGFVLKMGKGKPKLKEADGSGNPGCQFLPMDPKPPTYATVSCRSMTMDAFAKNLPGLAWGYFTNPVVDSTGLKGSWDFDLKWTEPRDQLAQAGADGISIFDAIDKQLGLVLELQKIPAPVIVVDRVNERPTDNPPGVAQILPALPTEFEVADVKLSAPEEKPLFKYLPGGRIDMRAETMRDLIGMAWNFDLYDHPDLIAGAPKWLASNHFNIIAKVSTDTGGPATAPQIDFDDLRPMLRALLVDRFKLRTHYEDRAFSAYTLVAVNPKLKRADTSNRSSCKESRVVARDPRDNNPLLGRLVTCQNTTMAQLADQLRTFAPGYIYTEVADATGIDGAWDFTLSFSRNPVLQSSREPGEAGQASGAVPTAADPNGALSIFDAVSKQLGLKLELHKRPTPVLVIDHVEEKPTDN
jgi:uncharacterized protein (TIGR03435 family)